MADKRITGLPALTTTSKDDVLLVVDDPAGTPTNKKVSIQNFFSNVESESVFANVTAASNSTTASLVSKGGLGVVKNLIVDGNVSVNGVFTLTGNGSISNLSSNLTPDTTITYDVGNTTASWKDAYIQTIKGHSGTLTVTANSTLSANLSATGQDTKILGTNMNVDSNTTFTANLIVHSDSSNTVINSGNTHITSNTILAGTNTVISSNVSASANINHTGALGLFNGGNVTVNANATFFGNVTLGVTSGDGNPKGADTVLLKLGAGNTTSTSNTTLEGTNTVISSNVTMTGANLNYTGTNTNFTSNSTIAGTNTVISSNVTMSGANVFVSGTNTHLTSNVTITANVSMSSEIDSSSNTTGALTVTGGVGIAKKATIGEDLLVHGNIHANGNITSDGDLTLGNADTDTVTFGADLGSSILPTTDSSYDLGNTTNRFANAYIDDLAVTSNVTVGTELTVSANTTLSDNTQIATDKSFIFRDSAIRIFSAEDGNMTVNADANVTLDSADIRMLGGDITIASNTTSSANVRLTSTIDSTTNTTGALTISGGVGVAKKVTIGENLLVHGNIHADGNITADGDLTLGDADTDTVSFGADVGSHIIPNTDSTYDLGTTAKRFRNIWLDDAVATGNVNASGDITATGNVSGLFGNFTDNVKISTDKSLQLRDDTEFIKSNADGEITVGSATKVTITTTSLNTSANTTLAGETANVTANLFISGANVIISAANTTLSGTKTTVSGTDLVVSANVTLPSLETNSIHVNASSNTNIAGVLNVTGNSTVTGNVTLGSSGTGSDLLVYANNANEYVLADSSKSELISNVQITARQTIRSDSNFKLTDDQNILFGSGLNIGFEAPTTTQTYIVTVANPGDGNKFYFDGKTATSFGFVEGGTYKFDVSDSTVSGHPLQFSSTDPGSSTTAYTTGVTVSGTAGQADAYVQIVVASGAKSATSGSIYPYCGTHGNMAGSTIIQIDEVNADGDLVLESDSIFELEDTSSERIFSNTTGMIFDANMLLTANANFNSANGVLNLGTYDGAANGVIRISDAYNLPNTAGSNGQFLRLINGNIIFASGTGTNMTDLVDDTTPQLGGKLDLNGQVIIDDSRANTVIRANTSFSDGIVKLGGSSVTNFLAFRESTGRVGINTVAPDATLQVVGTVNVGSTTKFSTDVYISGHDLTDNGLFLGSTLVTASAAEINTLDGFTGDVADLNKLSGTSDTLSSADLDAVENFEETVSATTSAVTIASGKDFNIAGHDNSSNGLKLGGTLVTTSASEFNLLDGLLANSAQLNRAQTLTPGTVQAERFVLPDSNKIIDFGSGAGGVHAGNVNVTSATTSTSNTTGALKVTGGVGIGKDVTIGQKLTVYGNTTINSNVTIAASVAGNQIFYDKATDDLNLKLRVVSLGATSTTSSDIGATANNVLVFGKGVKPTAFPDGQAYLYAKEVNDETHIHTVDEGGNETKLGPHNSDGEWEFYSKNLKTGKIVRINMERMIRKLEEFTGETFIQYE